MSAETIQFLAGLSADYPGFETWYRSKVIPGLATGSRHVLRVERKGVLAAIGIAKNESTEKKVCTIRVAPEFVGRGIGLTVLDGLLSWLGTDRPLLTVSDTKLPLFDRIFDRYGFALTSSIEGRYMPGRVEHGFNEAAGLRTLTLPLKAEYFDAIKAGTKTEEFRLTTPYWSKRLVGRIYDRVTLTKGYPATGDADRRLTLPWRGYRIATITHPHFGPEPVKVFAIDVSGAKP